ncbi:heptaprenyl diphosphate synthase [Ruminiclostridium sufflavum DSM 19573]|uniref:Heptaprenyl diphosphate synthase n=1 Tax=Ruminiclostridium sufflavum DSM 19573 TaxID=1121337 RepID=A0A318XM09_9FIRM|nr:polyprenyl synthetase family protein [Ruminiclostridium sufflavum]PYG87742.1 heptaprenyl diphosphate synthase [Ruminiclostridium sufflavum DSM 19573]
MTKENIKNQDGIGFIENTEALDMVKKEINRELTSAPVIIRRYTQHLASSGGKLIRAAALLICAQNENGLIHPHAVNFAAAIEIIHLATLVHDDVMDNAETRRGKITLQKKYGRKTAVICGDYLLCTALKLVALIPEKKGYLDLIVPDYMRRVCLGELNQHINNGFLDLSVYRYLKIISGKTAALFEASFYAGAVLNEQDELIISKYMKLGRYTGMIFQMTDDCIDFEKTEDYAKKPVQSDFEQGVITLPLIHAFRKMPGLRNKAESRELSREDINNAVEKSGGLSYTRMVSMKYYDKAMKIINELGITLDKKNKLVSVLEKACGFAKVTG